MVNFTKYATPAVTVILLVSRIARHEACGCNADVVLVKLVHEPAVILTGCPFT